MTSDSRPPTILVAGPYRSGSGDDPAPLRAGIRAVHRAGPAAFRAGQLPTGGRAARPPAEVAGGARPGEPLTDAVFSAPGRLPDRCGAVLPMGGASSRANRMAARPEAAGKPVVTARADVPATR